MKISETIREDGVRIISGKVFSKKIFVQLIAGVGSAYDPPEQRGRFHYFEHMAFKGTASRNVDDLRAFARKNILSSNASTGQIFTEYHGQAVKHKFSFLCDYICDIFFNSVYPAEEVEREKEVVLNEIAKDWDQDDYAVYFLLWENLWKNNPLRIFGVGSPDGVASITREDLLNAKQNWYLPSNTIAISTGAISHEEFVKEINKRVPLCDKDVKHLSWDDEYDLLSSNKELIVERPERKKATLAYGCKFPLYSDDKTNAIRQVLEYMLCKGSSSVLWNEIREKRGLAYTVSGGVSGEYPLGYYFGTYAECLPNRIDAVRELFYKFIHRPLEKTHFFEDTKEYLYDWYSLSSENLETWADLILGRIRKGKSPKAVERFFQRYCKFIQSVTFDEVENMRAELLKSEKFVTVVIKPV